MLARRLVLIPAIALLVARKRARRSPAAISPVTTVAA
jgi:hypothetical protein